MVDARGVVEKVSHLGCGGKVVTKTKLVSIHLLQNLGGHLLLDVDMVTQSSHIS